MKTPKEMAEEYAAMTTNNLFYREPLSNAFLAGYKAAAPQWISVKDRLPEPRDGSGINVLVLISGNGWHDHDVAYFGPTSWHDKYGDTVEGVTHWMPLPAAPKEEA